MKQLKYLLLAFLPSSPPSFPSLFLCQLEELRDLNGIQGIAKAEAAEDVSASLGEGKDGYIPTPLSMQGSFSSVREFLQSVSSPGDGLPSPMPVSPPGKQIFIHKPSLITEVYPPGIESNTGGMLSDFLVHGTEDDLKNIICGQMLPFAFLTIPCPPQLQQWLFQLMACLCDTAISLEAHKSLIGLLQSAKKLNPIDPPSSVPTVEDIVDVLVTLGADREKLRPLITQDGSAVLPVLDNQAGDEVFLPPKPPSGNLLHLVNYLSACLYHVPGCYNVQELEDLILILTTLSLDQFFSLFLKSSLQQCVQLLLAAYPDSLWFKAVQRLSPQLLCLSSHHHDRLSVAYLICRQTQRQKYLLRDFCVRCLVQMLGLNREKVGWGCSGKQGGEVGEGGSDACEEVEGGHEMDGSGGGSCSTKTLWKEVLLHYKKASLKEFQSEDYYQMHSVLHMLELCSPLSELTWSSEKEKLEHVHLLSTVCTEIRDDPSRPARAPVKELLIRMRLEIKSVSSTAGRQTDLFSFCT